MLLIFKLADIVFMLCEPIPSLDNISLLSLELCEACCMASTVRIVESTMLLFNFGFGLGNSIFCSLEDNLYLPLLGLSGEMCQHIVIRHLEKAYL